jgi:hypothetical protein
MLPDLFGLDIYMDSLESYNDGDNDDPSCIAGEEWQNGVAQSTSCEIPGMTLFSVCSRIGSMRFKTQEGSPPKPGIESCRLNARLPG